MNIALVLHVSCALHALVPLVPYVLRAIVLHTFLALRALVSDVPHALCFIMLHVPHALRALKPHVPNVLHAFVPHMSRALLALMLRAFRSLVPHLLRASCALCLCSTCFRIFRFLVPYVSLMPRALHLSCVSITFSPLVFYTSHVFYPSRDFFLFICNSWAFCGIYDSLNKDNI